MPLGQSSAIKRSPVFYPGILYTSEFCWSAMKMHGMSGLSLTLACALTPVCCGFLPPQIGYKLLVPTRLAYSPGTEHHVSHGKVVPDHPVTAGEWRDSDRLTSRLKRKKRKLGRDRRLRPAKREQLGKWVAWLSFFVHGKQGA